jgi:excisionase family DNA binding protein
LTKARNRESGADEKEAGAYSVSDVARLLGCSADSVLRLIRAGELHGVQPLGPRARVFIPHDAVDELLARPSSR